MAIPMDIKARLQAIQNDPANRRCVDCGDGIRTTKDDLPACCMLSARGNTTVEMNINCSIAGLSNDSGIAYAYVESVDGTQCHPPVRMTVSGTR